MAEEKSKPEDDSLRLFVDVEGTVIEIAIGEGGQSARWLATVAQRRSMTSRAYGSTSTTGAFMKQRKPVNLSLDGRSVPPATKLKDLLPRLGYDSSGHIRSGRAVKILKLTLQQPPRELACEVEDKGARPKQTAWEVEAFSHGDSAKRRLERRKKEMAAAEREETEARRRAEVSEMRRQQLVLERLMIGDLDDPGVVTAVLNRDWGIVRFNEMLRSTDNVVEVKKELMRVFVLLSDCFQHFSGASSKGRSDQLNVVEWTQLVMSMPGPIADYTHDGSAVAMVYRDTIDGRDPMEFPSGQLTRFMFIEAIIRLALWKYGTYPGESKRPTDMHATTALSALLDNHIVPGCIASGIGVARELLRETEVRSNFMRVLSRLRRVFDVYARADVIEVAADAESPLAKTADANTLSFSEFYTIVKDAELMSTRFGGIPLKRAHVFRVFASSQGEDVDLEADVDEYEHAHSVPGVPRRRIHTPELSDDSQRMIMREFVEGLTKLALMKFRKRKDLTNSEKVERVTQAVVKLDKHLVKTTKNAMSALKFMSKRNLAAWK